MSRALSSEAFSMSWLLTVFARLVSGVEEAAGGGGELEDSVGNKAVEGGLMIE
jgi:hypothetical protein